MFSFERFQSLKKDVLPVFMKIFEKEREISVNTCYRTVNEAEIESPSGKSKRMTDLWNEMTFGTTNDLVDDLFSLTVRVLVSAELALESRGYNAPYNLGNGQNVLESVGGHTNLVASIVSSILYWQDLNKEEDCLAVYNYTPFEIGEAVRRHDLPEVDFGDIPDNGNRDEYRKAANETMWQTGYAFYSPRYKFNEELRICGLIREMDDRSTKIGRLLYTADKLAAIIATLISREKGSPPMMQCGDTRMSNTDRMSMSICDERVLPDGSRGCHAAEQWTVGFFHRGVNKYDDTGLITCVLIIATLLCRGHWYRWREKEYIGEIEENS